MSSPDKSKDPTWQSLMRYLELPLKTRIQDTIKWAGAQRVKSFLQNLLDDNKITPEKRQEVIELIQSIDIEAQSCSYS